MFNFVNRNPFGQKIESAVSTNQDNSRQQQQNQQDDETNYLEDDDNDEVDISTRPQLTEEDILYLMNEYIEKCKNEHNDNPKIIQKLDKYKSKFDVKKFMKNNPNMNISDFNMIMFNEVGDLIN